MNPIITLQWLRIDRDEEPRATDLRILSADESERARRFKVTGARNLFVTARAALRRTLAEATDDDPMALHFEVGEHGKPRLSSASDLHFNLSHSGSTIVIAWAREIEIGVDVEEAKRNLEYVRLAERFFAQSEAQAISRSSEATLSRLFFHFWTAKEAVLKATGSGLSVPVRDVEISPDPDAPPSMISFGEDREEATWWQLLRTEMPGAWMATVAYRGDPRSLEVKQYRRP